MTNLTKAIISYKIQTEQLNDVLFRPKALSKMLKRIGMFNI